MKGVKTMRPQTKKLRKMLKEFLALKAKLFENNLFVVSDDSKEWQRYNELLGIFFPQFKTQK